MSASIVRNNTGLGVVKGFGEIQAGAFFELKAEPVLCLKLHGGAYKSFNPASLVEITDNGPECIAIDDGNVSITYDP